MIRQPDYETGRFFLSPILGCNVQCAFCYIYAKGYETRISQNEYDIDMTISYLESHSDFIKGNNGSIISIGAWGDPFPKYNKKACAFTLSWLERISELGNPIQIMSRYELLDETINEIVRCNKYEGHILYSISISSFDNYKKIEPFSDDPELRLKTLRTMRERGMATNVMIKPFIMGVTDKEVNNFIGKFNEFGVGHCVVGDLLIDERIHEKFKSLDITQSLISIEDRTQVLDCTSGEKYQVNSAKGMSYFSSMLIEQNVMVFKKSSCVNSFILKKKNPANYIQYDPNGYCIKCGVC